jgi:hypothetical protein
MKRFDNANIVKLLGVCTRGEPAYCVMEFMLYGEFNGHKQVQNLLDFSHILQTDC